MQGQIPYSDESVELGRKAFIKSCKECHGEEGRGNIVSGKKLEDDWGNRIWPRNLTKPWTWRATQIQEINEQERDETIWNIYTRLSIGIPGTPMPAHRAVEEGKKMHADAIATQFPQQDAYQVSPAVVKPLYRHGDARHSTTIWYWNAGSVEPTREAGGMLLDAAGPDRKLEPRLADSSLKTAGEWRHGQWRVVMSRPRMSSNGDVKFTEGQFILISLEHNLHLTFGTPTLGRGLC